MLKVIKKNLRASMLKVIKKNLRKFQLGIFREYFLDARHFAFYNGSLFSRLDSTKIAFRIVANAHAIEKGLTNKNLRPFFGIKKIHESEELLSKLTLYPCSGDLLFAKNMYLAAINAYILEFKSIDNPPEFFEKLKNKYSSSDSLLSDVGGSYLCPKSFPSVEYQNHILRRKSCRQFLRKKISHMDLEKIASLAQKAAPSQCNRQSVRLHYYSDSNQIKSLLELQRGALSFSDEIYNLFIITSDQRSWFGSAQRNQLYVDGGIFSGIFLLSLDSLGIQSCPLNLAVTNDIEKKIKIVGGIPHNERLVMMAAVGYGEDNFLAAVSPRRDFSSTLTTH